jgi:hypothetical protein
VRRRQSGRLTKVFLEKVVITMLDGVHNYEHHMLNLQTSQMPLFHGLVCSLTCHSYVNVFHSHRVKNNKRYEGDI